MGVDTPMQPKQFLRQKFATQNRATVVEKHNLSPELNTVYTEIKRLRQYSIENPYHPDK